ncbi:MAG: diguanylate cyclase [Oscillospiraceae bacterium]
MSINKTFFLVVPMFAMVCSLFLFLTVLSAKKTKIIYSFLLLLLTFTAWTTGSFFMRLGIYPGAGFWYELSVFGIFCVPICVYQFMYDYTGQKGTFVRNILAILSVGMAIINMFHVFISDPRIVSENGEQIFKFDVKLSIIIPIALAMWVFFLVGKMVWRSIKIDGMSPKLFTPLAVGLVALIIGTLTEVIPGIGTLPNDTFVCIVNTFCIYYSLYKRRLITLTQVTSKSPIYLVSAILTTCVLASFYNSFDTFFNKNFAEFIQYKTIVFAVLFSFCTMLIYQVVLRLANNLFVKSQIARDDELKNFSNAVSKTLNISEILDIFMDFATDNINGILVHMCLFDDDDETFHLVKSSDGITARDFSLSRHHPAVEWLEKNSKGIFLADFQRTVAYKSMWEKEKNQLNELNISYLLPIVCDNRLAAVVLISSNLKDKSLSFSETSFLESVGAVLSISIKNSRMYESMRNEARKDSLTELSNRRNFMEVAQQQLDRVKDDTFVLALLDLDDFHLYNELYGAEEGDKILKEFADIIVSIIDYRGTVARYSGKEFMVALPKCDVPTARSYIETVRRLLASHLGAENEKTKKFLTFSAGICAYPTSAANLTQLITNVGLAVFSAKSNGKNQIVVYKNSSLVGENNLEKDRSEAVRKKGIVDSFAPTIYALTAAINAKDHYTFAHSNNVSEYAMKLAQNMGIGSELVEIIRQAGLLHDIGKIGIPESILSKNGRLTAEEYKIMQTHVENSIDIIRHLPSLDYVIPVAIGHHEHWDGKGYPRGLAGEEIPFGARCLCVADSFDAMVSRRSYKEPMKIDDALREIERGLSRQFDPEIGAKFVQLVRDGVISVHQDDEMQPIA